MNDEKQAEARAFAYNLLCLRVSLDELGSAKRRGGDLPPGDAKTLVDLLTAMIGHVYSLPSFGDVVQHKPEPKKDAAADRPEMMVSRGQAKAMAERLHSITQGFAPLDGITVRVALEILNQWAEERGLVERNEKSQKTNREPSDIEKLSAAIKGLQKNLADGLITSGKMVGELRAEVAQLRHDCIGATVAMKRDLNEHVEKTKSAFRSQRRMIDDVVKDQADHSGMIDSISKTLGLLWDKATKHGKSIGQLFRIVNRDRKQASTPSPTIVAHFKGQPIFGYRTLDVGEVVETDDVAGHHAAYGADIPGGSHLNRMARNWEQQVAERRKRKPEATGKKCEMPKNPKTAEQAMTDLRTDPEAVRPEVVQEILLNIAPTGPTRQSDWEKYQRELAEVRSHNANPVLVANLGMKIEPALTDEILQSVSVLRREPTIGDQLQQDLGATQTGERNADDA